VTAYADLVTKKFVNIESMGLPVKHLGKTLKLLKQVRKRQAKCVGRGTVKPDRNGDLFTTYRCIKLNLCGCLS
jgi:hypothetical protein